MIKTVTLLSGTVTIDDGVPDTPEPEPPEDDFILGVTEPIEENTGPRVPETAMSNYDGNLTNVAEGEVLDRLIISGRFRPETSKWRLRDSIVLGGEPPEGETIWALWDMRDSDVHSGLIEYSEIRSPKDADHRTYGYKGGNVTVYRSIIRGTVDGLQPHGSGTYPNTNDKSVVLLGSLVEGLLDVPDPGQSDGWVHADGVQASGALSKLVIVGNKIHGGVTSCILIQQQSGVYGMGIVLANWLYGNPETGSTFNTSQNGKGVIGATGAFVVGANRVDRNGHSPHMLMSQSTLNAATTVLLPNTYMDDGSEVPWTKGAD